MLIQKIKHLSQNWAHKHKNIKGANIVLNWQCAPSPYFLIKCRKKRTHSSNTTADESNHEQIKTESNINKRNPTSKAGASKQITASVNKRRSFTEQKTSNTAVISSDLEVKSSDNDKASKVVNKLPESKKGLVVGEQELAAVASNHFTKQEADHCKKESRSNVVSNQQVKVGNTHTQNKI